MYLFDGALFIVDALFVFGLAVEINGFIYYHLEMR